MAIIKPGPWRQRNGKSRAPFLTYTRNGKLLARAAPRKRGPAKTPFQKSLNDRLRALNVAAQKMSARELTPLIEALDKWSKKHRGQLGSANIRLHDILMQQLSGRWIAFVKPDGKVLWPAAVREDVSCFLDWCEPRLGSLLTRVTDGWRCTRQCSIGSVFMVVPDGYVGSTCCGRSDLTGPPPALESLPEMTQ